LEKKQQVNLNKRKNFSASLYEVMYTVKTIYVRCLTIASSLLRTCKPTLKDPGIGNLLGSFIGPSFQKDDPDIRNLSLECLALYVILEKRICKEYFGVF